MLTESRALTLAISPQGTPYLAPAEADDLDPVVRARIAAAFARGAGHGLVYLALDAHDTALPPSLSYLRGLASALLSALAASADLEASRGAAAPEPPRELLEEWVASTPPMQGAEYVTEDALASMWNLAHGAFRAELAAHEGTVASFLRARSSAFALVGRVCFHLAENKGDEDAPFAFLATYTTRVSGAGREQHRPLGRALEEYAGARNKAALLALLEPVRRAADASDVVRALVDAGDVYHPLAWTPDEALAFLREVPKLEGSGIVVRVPDWWNPKKPPRPEVRVTVGAKPPSTFGKDAVLDFDVTLAIGDEPLTEEERRALLSAASGLRLVRGKWVEVDAAKISEVLSHWKDAKRAVAQEGLSFNEGMRLLAGARFGDADAAKGEGSAAHAWSRVAPGAWMRDVLDALRTPEAAAARDPGDALKATLRPYQRAGLAWLATLSELGLGGCLADDMGLGKTIQVLALLLATKAERARRKAAHRPHVLVVPASLLGNWTSEAERFAPSLRLLVAHPSEMRSEELKAMPEERLADVDVVLTTYGTLHRAPWIGERAWDIAVLDEAQAIKNPGAKQTRAAKALRARVRFALTGTPVENRLGDLWSLFDFVAPGLLGDAKAFGRATRALEKRSEGAYAPIRRLVRPYILRRLKTDPCIAPDLPEKTEVRAFCTLTRAQATLYAREVTKLSRDLDSADGMARRGAILAALTRFKQICNHPSQASADGEFSPGASGKFARLREIAETLAERQERALVFTQFQEITGPLARFLESIFGRPGLVLHGGTSVKERPRLVAEFQKEGGPPFFVVSLKAGGTGLNLTAATHVIHFDRWWNPAVEDQATDRAYRIGQRKNVLVHKFVCRGTVEEKIDALLASKKALAREVLEGANEVALTEMTNEQILSLVALDLASALEEPT